MAAILVRTIAALAVMALALLPGQWAPAEAQTAGGLPPEFYAQRGLPPPPPPPPCVQSFGLMVRATATGWSCDSWQERIQDKHYQVERLAASLPPWERMVAERLDVRWEWSGVANYGSTWCYRYQWSPDGWLCRGPVTIVLGFNFDAEDPEWRERVDHELGHAADFLDDGLLNGSPGHGPRPATFVEAQRVRRERSDWQHLLDPEDAQAWYCWAGTPNRDAAPTVYAAAEWYACEVARTGVFR